MLARDPGRLRFPWQDRPGLTVIRDDLTNIERHAGLLAEMDLVVHAAAAWGGEEAFRVNVDATHRLFDLLDPGRLRRALYFSTASILDREHRPIPEAASAGTEYIRSKYQAYVGLGATRAAARITTLFPTLILGGDERHPYTFLAAGLPDVFRWAWLARFLTVDGSLHFIHARDIGRIAAHLLAHDPGRPTLVLGNAPLQAGEAVAAICRFYGLAIPLRLDLTPAVNLAGRLFGPRMSPWDRFCMAYRHFVYDAVSAATYGLPADLAELPAALASLPNLKHAPGG